MSEATSGQPQKFSGYLAEDLESLKQALSHNPVRPMTAPTLLQNNILLTPVGGHSPGLVEV